MTKCVPAPCNSTLLAELTTSVGQKKQYRIGKMWLGVVLLSFLKNIGGSSGAELGKGCKD